MGQRANLIVVTASKAEIYYTHWRANCLDRDLFWGPEHALAFIRQQRSEAEGAELLDEVWAEGGAILDTAKRLLLWWGGECILHEVPRRRLFLDLMARVWKGWEVRWAYEGIADMANYLSVPRERVLRSDPLGEGEPDLSPPQERGWVDSVLAVRGLDSALKLFPLAGDVEDRLWDCDRLLSVVAKIDGHPRLDMGEWTKEFPTSGAYVDASRRAVNLWTAADMPALEPRLQASNPSWSIEWNRDRFETQLEWCAGDLVMPLVDPEALLEQLRETLLAAPFDRTDLILDVAAKLDAEVSDVNPFALRDNPLPVDADQRVRVLDEAIAKWREGTEA